MSRGFRFRLDAALLQRARQEQALQITLARSLQALTAAQSTLEQQRRQLAAAQQHTDEPGNTFDLERRVHLLLHVDRFSRLVQQQQRALQQQMQEIQQLRQRLIHASARRRALERLRERQKAEYDSGLQRRLDQELDEQGTLRYTRSGVERSDAHAPLTEY